jgi:hypothetical protein
VDILENITDKIKMNNRIHNIIRFSLVIIFISGTLLISRDNSGASHTVTIVIPKIALLEIESVPSSDITLTMASPSEAQASILSNIDNNLQLNVTSFFGSGNTRDISAKIESPINGLDLKVVSEAHSGSGFGSWGVPQSELILTTADQTLVSGIKSEYKVDGANNGFNLKYTVISNNIMYAELASSSENNITVTYTLTQ